ncbi:MAG: sigma-70 family RNA polymerase sigma factor [Clostridia bacterium]|nr:sigma-70 family RNA polymerase sigma factor [Clostridia bacterium]
MSDEEIIRLLREHDEAALDEITKKYRNYCYTVFLNVLSNEADCEECMNDLLMHLFAADVREVQSLRQYLGAAARNVAYDRYKTNMRLKRNENQCEAFDELEATFSAEDVENAVENRELSRAINSFLRSLDKRERVLFIRRYYFLESTKKLSAEFDLSCGAVLRRLSRTRIKLKDYLLKEGFQI